MSNIDQAGKAVETAARAESRGWIAAHPYQAVAIAYGAGALTLLVLRFIF